MKTTTTAIEIAVPPLSECPGPFSPGRAAWLWQHGRIAEAISAWACENTLGLPSEFEAILNRGLFDLAQAYRLTGARNPEELEREQGLAEIAGLEEAEARGYDRGAQSSGQTAEFPPCW